MIYKQGEHLMEKISSNSKFPGVFLKKSGKQKEARLTKNAGKTSSTKQRSTDDFKTLLGEGNVVDAEYLLTENGAIDEEKLSSLQDAIHRAGEQLIEKPGIDSVLEYKSRVQFLLRAVQPLLHKKETIALRKRIGSSVQERKFTLIHTVEKKLDSLLQLVLRSQGQQMEIMRAMDEIRGLIVDILH